MADSAGALKERGDIRVRKPDKYNVILHNDDVTPMDYVVMILCEIFFKSNDDAVTLMLKVHNEGSAVAGTYSRDIAMTKKMHVDMMNRANGFDLKVTVEKA